MGGSSSSASSSETDNIDRRVVTDSGVGVSGDGNHVYMTTSDSGAIRAGRDIAMQGLFVADNSVTQALEANVRVNEDALAYANSAVQSSLAASSNAFDNSLAYANSAMQSSLAASASAFNNSLASSSAVSRDALSLADRSQGLVFQSQEQALGMVQHIVDALMIQTEGATDAVQTAVNQVARAYDTATNYQAEKATLDTRYLVVAGMAVVGMAAMRMFK